MKFFSFESSRKLAEMGCVSESEFIYNTINRSVPPYHSPGIAQIIQEERDALGKFPDLAAFSPLDFWPSTGLFINLKTKRRGRGVFNIIKAIAKA